MPPELEWDDIFCGHCPMWESFPWDEKCDDCEKKHESTRGLCRANPPAIKSDGRGVWPVTNNDDWCSKGRFAVLDALEPEGDEVDKP